jgi:hypothetical protein
LTSESHELNPSPSLEGKPGENESKSVNKEDWKKGSILAHPHIMFQLHGNQFRFRAGERAGKKFKHKETIEL